MTEDDKTKLNGNIKGFYGLLGELVQNGEDPSMLIAGMVRAMVLFVANMSSDKTFDINIERLVADIHQAKGDLSREHVQ